ncbi:MAG: GLPGLI family protein [Puia sp.]|nr:GLPGLI family protein [Puia sp.]
MKFKIYICVVLTATMILYKGNSQSNVVNKRNNSPIGKEQIISKVFYDLVYLKYKSLPDNLYKEEFILELGKTTSMFISYSYILRDSARQKAVEAQANQIPLDQPLINLLSANVSNDQFYTLSNPSNQVIQIQHIATSTYLIADTVGAIQWKVLDSTRDIQGYLCQKASGESHGRNYTAWFCIDLPYNFGPRRLNGLPGLILEAYDDQREILYTLNHIEQARQDEKLELPPDGIKATYKEYKKVLSVFEKDPAAFWNKSLGQGAKIHAVNGRRAKGPADPKNATEKPIENPIDLK